MVARTDSTKPRRAAVDLPAPTSRRSHHPVAAAAAIAAAAPSASCVAVTSAGCGDGFVAAFARALQQRMAPADVAARMLPPSRSPLAAFHSRSAPSVALESYVARLLRFSGTSESIFVSSLVLVDRFLYAVASHVVLSHLNVHRLILVAVVLCAKMHDDVTYLLSYYVRVGGLSSAHELAFLESLFLTVVDYKLFISENEFQQKSKLIDSFKTYKPHLSN